MAEASSTLMTIAVLGGTGHEGFGLALRWAGAGYRVLIGSRDAARAQSKADELNALLGHALVRGLDNISAAAEANVIVLTVPYTAHHDILAAVKDAVQGKILIDVTVPLKPPAIRTVHIPEGKAAALEAQAILGDGVRVVAAFQNVSAEHLVNLAHSVNCDVLVCGNDAAAKAEVFRLIETIEGARAIDAGSLQNAVAVEALTPVLLYINKHYKVSGTGIRITGLE